MGVYQDKLMALNTQYRKGQITAEQFTKSAKMLQRSAALSQEAKGKPTSAVRRGPSKPPQRGTPGGIGPFPKRPIPPKRLPGGITKEVYGAASLPASRLTKRFPLRPTAKVTSAKAPPRRMVSPRERNKKLRR